MAFAANAQQFALQGEQGSESTSGGQPSLKDVMIESYGNGMVPRKVLTYDKDDKCRITRACVESLGHKLVNDSDGTEKAHIELCLRAEQGSHAIDVCFEIVVTDACELSLDEAKSEELHHSSSGENYPVVPAPISKKTRKKRTQEREGRLQAEKQASEAEARQALTGEPASQAVERASTAQTSHL